MALMALVWAYLDKEYGKLDLLAANQIMELHSYQTSNAVTTDAAKLEKLYQILQ